MMASTRSGRSSLASVGISLLMSAAASFYSASGAAPRGGMSPALSIIDTSPAVELNLRELRGDPLFQTPPTPSGFATLIRIFFCIAIACLIWADCARPALAKAPPHATTLVTVDALAAPEPGDAITTIPAHTEVELTGDAAPGFLAINYDDQILWVPAQFLSIGDRPGVDTAVAMRDTPILDAPLPDARTLGIVPRGEAVILTGANVGDYEAGSFDGTGGWLLRNDLER